MEYKIFVSGVQKEVEKERKEVQKLISETPILKDYFEVFLFEDAPARGKSSKDLYLKEVTEADIYVGVFNKKYGRTDKSGVSATEKEFRTAKENDKELLIFIKGSNKTKRDAELKKLISEIKDENSGYKYSRFANIEEFRTKLHESLIEFLKEEGAVGKAKFEILHKEGFSIKDIDDGKIKWFLRAAKEKRRYPLDIDSSVKKTLTHLNLLIDGKISNAAILLFGKNPKKYHIQSEIKCLQLSGTEIAKPFPSYHIYQGTLFEQIDRALGFVLDSIRLPVIQQTHTAQALRPPEIPPFVIQEAIVNAVAHRNYNSNAAVQVIVFTDRVEVWNPGKLPSQLTVDKLKQPHNSCPTNPLLAEVLFWSSYVQKAGSGTLEMVKQCRENGLPEPEFITPRGEFRIIIPRDVLTESRLKKMGLKERQLKAVKYVKENGKITNKEYQKITGLKKRQSTDDLNLLEEKEIFKRTGKTGKGVCYIIKGAPKGQKGH
jgi:predicted HTH transcriptional regulator